MGVLLGQNCRNSLQTRFDLSEFKMSCYFAGFNRNLKSKLAYHILGIIVSSFFLTTPVVYALKLDNDNDLNPAFRSSFITFIAFLNKYSVVCINLNNEELEYEFLKIYKINYSNYSIVINEEFDRVSKDSCNVLVKDFETNSSTSCGEMFQFQIKPRTLIFLISDMAASVVSSLEACLSVTQSPEVLALSLSDSSLLQLSPVLPQPRHFLNTSLSEVLQRPVHKSQKLDLQGSAVTVATTYFIPFIIFKDRNATEVTPDEVDGIDARLLKELIHQLNGTVQILLCNDSEIVRVNGSWTGGIFQAMQDGSAELTFAGYWQDFTNYDIFDLSPAHTKVSLSFIVRRPKQIDLQWQSFLLILKPSVSISVLVTFALVVIVYWASAKLMDFHYINQGWQSCLLTIFGYFLATHSQSRRRGDSTRFTLTSWSMFSLLITTFLSSGIVTRLTVPLYEARVDSLQQLVEGQYYWTVPYYKNWLNDTEMVEFMFDLKNKWARMFEKRYQFLEPPDVLKKIKSDEKITFSVQRYGDCFVVIHNNAGLMTYWKKEVIRKYPKYDTRHLLIERDVPTFSEPQMLNLDKLEPIFFVVMFGSILAFFVFLVEVFWNWYQRDVAKVVL